MGRGRGVLGTIESPLPCEAVDCREIRPGGGIAIRPGGTRVDRLAGGEVAGVELEATGLVAVGLDDRGDWSKGREWAVGLVMGDRTGEVGGKVFVGIPLLSGTSGFQAVSNSLLTPG